MFLTAHTAAALWITTQTTSPFLAFIFGIMSHFILDIIPHGDGMFAQHIEGKKEKVWYLFKVGTIDMLLLVILIYFFIIKYPQDFNPYVLIGTVCGAILPDIMWGIIDIFKLKFLYWYIKFHSRIHHLIKSHYSFVYGIPLQMFFTLLIIKIIF